MGYKLRITFSGLCLFVPKRNTANQMRMHVLMPNASVGQHCRERHIPVLVFDTAHLRPAQTRNDEIAAHRDLSELSMSIGNAEAGEFICPQIVKLREVTGRDVPTNLLDPSPGTARLGARVTLGDGRMTVVGKGKCWEWAPGQAQRMAHVALWEINMMDDELRLRLDPLGSGMARELPVLYPIGTSADNRVINLAVRHLPPEELAPIAPPMHEPKGGEPSGHFTAYYDLYGPLPYIRLPRYSGDACILPADPCPEDVELGSSAFNCMLGSGA